MALGDAGLRALVHPRAALSPRVAESRLHSPQQCRLSRCLCAILALVASAPVVMRRGAPPALRRRSSQMQRDYALPEIPRAEKSNGLIFKRSGSSRSQQGQIVVWSHYYFLCQGQKLFVAHQAL